MKKSVIMVLALTALFGCSKMEQEVGVDVNGNPTGGVPVDLTGVIEGTASTRGGVIDAIPTGGLELNLYRADATSVGTYSSGFAAINGVLQQSGAITGHGQYWIQTGESSAFIAVYPRFTSYSGGVISGTLDGSTDLMSSNLAQGDKTTSGGISLKLAHLLTKIEVEVIASATDDLSQTVNTWGSQVTSIDLLSQANNVALTLPSSFSVASFPAAATVSPTYTNSVDFALKNSDGTTAPAWTISKTGATFGYVMFAPGTGKTLTFKVKTTGVTAGRDVTVAAKDYVAGKRYKMIFTFSAGGGGIGVAVLESDSDGGLFTWDDPATGPDNTNVGL
jgi:hypothetical protein